MARVLFCQTFLYYVFLVVEGVAPIYRGVKPVGFSSNHFGFEPHAREIRWAEQAFNLLRNLNCDQSMFASSKECERLSRLQRSEITVYLAQVSPYGRYTATVPDEELSHGSRHDAVLVLDPYPGASFGHVVLVFFVDTSSSKAQCQKKDGIFSDYDECMHIAVRRRCRNIIERRAKGRNFSKRCEINFLPTVHLDTDKNAIKTNHLECLTSLHGFNKCPTLRSPGDSAKLLCDSGQHASRTCSSTYVSVRTSCRVMEICDQAVILSGGWNRLTTGVSYVDNVMSMYHLLRRNRFKRRNIKIFFANGISDFQVPNESPLTVYSAAMKLGFRQHVQQLCASPHCVDSLVIYLNSPALNDGSMLLWDVNQNGIAEDWEKYTVDELMADLARCTAKQTLLLVDQSYSGEIAKVLKESVQHSNMMVLTNGKENEYSYTSEFSHFWSKQNDTRSCVTDIFKESSVMTEHSTPVMVNPGNIRTTLSGAPCDVRPRFSNRELRREYFGCQNLPTAVWVQGNF